MRIVITSDQAAAASSSPAAGTAGDFGSAQPARQTRTAQARDAAQGETWGSFVAASWVQRPTGVTKPVFRRFRLAEDSGKSGTSASDSLAWISASTGPGG